MTMSAGRLKIENAILQKNTGWKAGKAIDIIKIVVTLLLNLLIFRYSIKFINNNIKTQWMSIIMNKNDSLTIKGNKMSVSTTY